jgi:DNA-binding response OmpR family regulator
VGLTAHKVSPRYNVLLIEDDTLEVELARRAAVESCPEIELMVLENADVVLDWLQNAHMENIPHIILLDLKLPKLDGLGLLRKLRMHDATRDIPIVSFSAAYTHEEVLMSYQLGANTFVSKPTDLAQFNELITEKLKYWMHPRQREMFFSGKTIGETHF